MGIKLHLGGKEESLRKLKALVYEYKALLLHKRSKRVVVHRFGFLRSIWNLKEMPVFLWDRITLKAH